MEILKIKPNIMKIKMLHLLLLTLISIKSVSQYTAIPDSNFENLLSAYDDIPNDNQILTSNIENITSLNVNFSNIIDLTGIEDFSTLTHLWCSGNQITTLDLSNNLNLQSLSCNQNLLTSLNITNCTQLSYFTCGDNFLSELNISTNINLESLDCSNNLLVNLHTILNSNLEYIYCSNNQIENITISENISGLSCSNNQITELDLSTHQNLWSLSCNNNLLISLNVRNGNNTSFENTFNSLNNPNLTCIFVDNLVYSSENWINIDPNSTFVEVQSECDVLIINDELKQNIKLFPNPTSNIIYIENYDNIVLEKISILNTLGQQVKECKTSDKINLSKFSKGTYFIKIRNNKGHIAIYKIIKN